MGIVESKEYMPLAQIEQEAFLLTELPSSELIRLLGFKEIKDFKAFFSIDELDKIATQQPIVAEIAKLNAHTQAFRRGLNKSIIPIDTWCFITGVTTVAFFGASALPITICSLGLGLVVGGYYFRKSFQEQQKKITDFKNFVVMAHLKLTALDLLIEEKENALPESTDEDEANNLFELTQTKASLSDKEKALEKPTFKDSFKIGATVFLTLGISYIAGAGFLFQSLGVFAATALTGPVGWGILAGVLAFAICAGLYFGYKHFQDKKVRYEMDSYCIQKEKEIETQHTKYKKLCIRHSIFSQKEKASQQAPVRVSFANTPEKDTNPGFFAKPKTPVKPQAAIPHNHILVSAFNN